MRKPWRTVAAIALLVPLALQAQVAAPAQHGRVIVKFKETSGQARSLAATTTTSTRRAQALSARTGLRLSDGRAIASRVQVVHADGVSSADLAARLALETDVEYAVVDQRRHVQMVPNDPRYAGAQAAVTPAVGQWYLRAPGTSAPAAINAEGAWNRATGAGVVVAVLDTGVRFDHPDLATKFYPGHDFVTDVSTANDNTARDSDASDPGDWVSSGDLATDDFDGCTQENSSWHGTQVSGLIGAATNNRVGMAGVGGDVMILPVRVLGKCGGYDSDIVAGMRWAAGLSVPNVPLNTHPARVLNLSLGGSGACSAAYSDAISELGASAVNPVVVVSAGNDGLAVSSPANCAGVIAVAGVRHVGTKVGYSSLGTQVSISAPAGNCVNTSGACLYPLLTTTNAGTTVPSTHTYSDSTNISVGTSFAAPLVAGAAALLVSADPTLTPAQIRAHLRNSARPFPSTGADAGVSACHAPNATPQDSECYCTTSTCGAGLLDVDEAVKRVVTTVPVTPVVSFDAAAVSHGASFTLDSSSSVVPAGHTVTTAWSVVSGEPLATITSAANAATVTLQAVGSGNGDIVIRLALTDTVSSQTSTRDATVRLGPTTVPTPVQPPPATSGGGGGGGGGGLGPLWLAGLALAVAALQLQRKRLALGHARC